MPDDSFDGLISDITGAMDIVPKAAKQAVQQTALRTKAQWRKLAKGNPLGRQYTATIDYTLDAAVSLSLLPSLDSRFGRTEFQAEIGPDLARYGGKTGRGGLVPSAGIFDDPDTPVSRPPDRARRAAERFAEEELEKGIQIALDQSLRAKGL